VASSPPVSRRGEGDQSFYRPHAGATTKNFAGADEGFSWRIDGGPKLEKIIVNMAGERAERQADRSAATEVADHGRSR